VFYEKQYLLFCFLTAGEEPGKHQAKALASHGCTVFLLMESLHVREIDGPCRDR